MDNRGKRATINCEGWFIDNQGDRIVFDSTFEKEPVTFEVGTGQVIPGIEEAVTNMAVGQTAEFTFPPEKAFGAYDEDRCETVPMANLPAGDMIKVGGFLPFVTEEGKPGIGQVLKIMDEDVLFDFNHPFAGKTITYRIQLLDLQ